MAPEATTTAGTGGLIGTGTGTARSLEVATESAEQTRALARRLGSRLLGGDVVVLSGELGAGKTTKPKFYADDRVMFIVWDGSVRVTIDGTEPFTATKGFMVSVPFRHVYSIENIGTRPALWFEVRQAGSAPLYPGTVTPDPQPGRTYMKVTGNPGPAKDRDSIFAEQAQLLEGRGVDLFMIETFYELD